MQAQDECHENVAQDALVAVGANLPGEMAPKDTVRRAMAAVADLSEGGVDHSALYATPAYPPGSGPDFVNAALRLRWGGTARALLDALHGIEAGMGRERRARWEARVIDLDLIALGKMVLPDTRTQTRWAALPPARAGAEAPDTLILPHPRMAERGFVLVPLADVAPDWVHPVTGQSVAQMLDALPGADRAAIRRL